MSHPPTHPQLNIDYGQSGVLYASQFLLNATEEEIILDCSAGLETNEESTRVPVHTRLAMNWHAVERLHRLLEKAIRSRTAAAVPAPHLNDFGAKLPSFDDALR